MAQVSTSARSAESMADQGQDNETEILMTSKAQLIDDEDSNTGLVHLSHDDIVLSGALSEPSESDSGSGSDNEDEDEDGSNEGSEADSYEDRTKLSSLKKSEPRDDKKLRKQAVKDEKREKRKMKMPKAVKKRREAEGKKKK